MSARFDLDRSIEAWLESEAPERAPEHLLGASRNRIRTTPQRRAWRPARRDVEMSSYVKLAAAAAAVLILAVGGGSLILGGGLGARATAAPSPTAAPSVNATQAPTASQAGAVIVPGQFTACVPSNTELKTGTHEQSTVAAPEAGTTLEQTRSFTWKGAMTATDPRFSGTHYYSWDANTYTSSSQSKQSAYAEGHRIENADGAWSGWSVGASAGGTLSSGPVVLTGEGAYKGLSAVLVSTVQAGCFFSFSGFLIEVPERPVPYTGG